MYAREESEYFTAKRKAASKLGVNFKFQPQDLPSNREIRDEIQKLACLYEGESRFTRLRDMRLAALRMMRSLAAFHPRLIGSVLTGFIRTGSDIDIHLFSDSIPAITETLQLHGLDHHVERKRVIKFNEERLFTHIHIEEEYPIELTIYELQKVRFVFKSSITGKAIRRASINELVRLIEEQHPEASTETELWEDW